MLGMMISQRLSAAENPCLSCHVNLKESAKSVHAALGLGCQACHKAVEGKSHPDQKDSIKLIKDMPGICYDCHDESKFKEKAVHAPVASGMCTGCHDAHQSNFPKILLKDIPDLCYNCHEEAKFKDGKSGHTLIGMCTGCHAPHSSNSGKLLLTDQPDLCYTCHDKSKFSKKYVHSIIPVGGCTSCHTPHTGPFPSLLTKKSINESCITCHLNKSDGRHVVSVPGKKIHPVSRVKDPSVPWTKIVKGPRTGKDYEVPDPEKPGKEMSCISCHNPHSSDYKKLFPVANLCGKCHKYY
jgi:predicted CXXCH cytochrome family protein